MKKVVSFLACVLTPATVLWAASTASASEDNFFKGKTLRIIVSYEAGGGFDLIARLMSRRMPNYIPGRPTIVVQNMPGAGGTVATNFLYNAVNDEGLTLGILHSTQAVSQLTKEAGVRFDFRQFKWLGAVGTGAYVLAVDKDKFTGLADLEKSTRPLFIATSRPGESNFDYPAVLAKYGNLNLKLVKGYRGTRPIGLALEKREVDGGAGSLPTILSRYPKSLKIIIGNESARRTVPDIISDRDVVKSKEGREVLAALTLPQEISKGVIAPPNFPDAGVQILVGAWNRLIVEPEFLAESEKLIMSESSDFVRSDRVREVLKEMFALPESTWQHLVEIRKFEAASKKD